MRFFVLFVMLALFGAGFFAPRPAFAAKNLFVGVAKCAKCHDKIAASWKERKHANVFSLLSAGVRADVKKEFGLKPTTDYRDDVSCLACHTTGIGLGGYDPQYPDLAWQGIGCEMCHGAAEKWLDIHDRASVKNKKRRLKQTGMKKPLKGKTVCVRCHGSMNSPFKERSHNFDRDWTLEKWNETYHITPEPKPKPEPRP